MKRTCKKCLVEKDMDEFVKHKQCKYGRAYTCKVCNWKKRAPEFKRDRVKRSARENELNRERKRIIVEHFGGNCHDCKQSFPDYVYDFHHLEPNEKDFKISMFRKRPSELLSYKPLMDELRKCVMLCSNCHRIRHWSLSDKTDGEEE